MFSLEIKAKRSKSTRGIDANGRLDSYALRGQLISIFHSRVCEINLAFARRYHPRQVRGAIATLLSLSLSLSLLYFLVEK